MYVRPHRPSLPCGEVDQHYVGIHALTRPTVIIACGFIDTPLLVQYRGAAPKERRREWHREAAYDRVGKPDCLLVRGTAELRSLASPLCPIQKLSEPVLQHDLFAVMMRRSISNSTSDCVDGQVYLH